jgi:hypothetical protein
MSHKEHSVEFTPPMKDVWEKVWPKVNKDIGKPIIISATPMGQTDWAKDLWAKSMIKAGPRRVNRTMFKNWLNKTPGMGKEYGKVLFRQNPTEFERLFLLYSKYVEKLNRN